MVTDYQLSKIMQLRANGRTHQEIADELGISRSTVAYQLSKLSEKEIPDDPIQIIIANSFEPNMTTVTFTPHEFEKHRKNQQLYAAGRSLFELRDGVIHKTDIPSVLTRPEDYPKVARIIGQNPNWANIPNTGQWKQELNRLVPSNNHSQNAATLNIFSNIKQKIERDLWSKIPNDNVDLIKLSETDINPFELYNSALGELRALLNMDPSTRAPSYMTHWAKENEIPIEDIQFCITNQIVTKSEYNSLKKSGARSRQEYDMMKKAGYHTLNEYNRAVTWANVIQQPLQHNPYRKGHTSVNSVPPGQLEELDKSGWEPNEYRMAKQLGFNLHEKELHDELKIKLPNLGLKWDQQNISWAKSVNLQHYEGFPSPKAATMYGIIEMSPTSHLRLDSLLVQYNQSSAPGHNINSVDALHKILIQPPFSDICVSNLDGGIVERTSNNLGMIGKLGEQAEVREVIREVEVTVVKEVEVIKEVEQPSSMEPLFDLSSYKHFTGLLQNDGFPHIRDAAEMARNAINRGELKSSYKETWAVFGAVAREIVDPEKEGDFNKKLIEQVGAEIGLSKSDKDDLHKLRMIRNDIEKARTEGHSNQHPTVKHLQRCIALIDRIMSQMPMTKGEVPSTSQAALPAVTKKFGPSPVFPVTGHPFLPTHEDKTL